MDKVELTINNRKWSHFSDFELTLGLDSYSAAGFRAPFDYERAEVREAFRPTSYHPVDVRIDGIQVFAGRMYEVTPEVSASGSEVTVTAYAHPFQLTKSCPPADMLPLEFNGLTLHQIAAEFCRKLGIGLAPIDVATFPQARNPFGKAKCEKDQVVQDFLVDLAKQRGFVLTNTPDGRLDITGAVTVAGPGSSTTLQDVATGETVTVQGPGLQAPPDPRGRRPVAVLKGQPVLSVVPTFSDDIYYSEITGFASKKPGKPGGKYTQKNPRYLGTNIAPLSFLVDDTDAGDLPDAVRAKMGRMFGNAVSYVVELPTWRDPQGGLWWPNTLVTLTAPEAMIYRPTNLLVRNVVLRQSASQQTASLGLVLPESFGDEMPAAMPWEEPNSSGFRLIDTPSGLG